MQFKHFTFVHIPPYIAYPNIKEMLKLCEDYALKHKIIFNASKSQLLYFPSNTARVQKDFMLK